MTSTNETNDDDLDFDLEITKVSRRARGGGTWVSGTLNGTHRFDALVFPEHADNPEWEIGDSRISKLWLSHIKTKDTSYNWDRGLDIPAANKKVQALVDFLYAGLAEHIYGE